MERPLLRCAGSATMAAKNRPLIPLRLARLCREIALDKKATDVVILDVRKISSLTDFLVICSGQAEPHLKAIADELHIRLKQDQGICEHHRDGSTASKWLVLDYVDVVVHIFHPTVRERYALEDLWRDARRVK